MDCWLTKALWYLTEGKYSVSVMLFFLKVSCSDEIFKFMYA